MVIRVLADSLGWRYLVRWSVVGGDRLKRGEEDGLAVANVVEQGGEVDGAEVQSGLEGWVRVGVDVVSHGDDALDVIPGMGRVVVVHVGLDMGGDGLDEGVVGEGGHGRVWG